MKYCMPFLLSENALPVNTFFTQIPSQVPSSIKAHTAISQASCCWERHISTLFPKAISSLCTSVDSSTQQHFSPTARASSIHQLRQLCQWAPITQLGQQRGQRYWTTKLFQKALALIHLSSLQSTWVPPIHCKTVRRGNVLRRQLSFLLLLLQDLLKVRVWE